MNEITAASYVSELAPPLLATINARSYIEIVNAPKKATRAYLNSKKIDTSGNFLLPPLEMEGRAVAIKEAFDDLFSIEPGDDEALKQFRGDYGSETDALVTTKNRVVEGLDDNRARMLKDAPNWSTKRRIWESLAVVKNLPAATPYQRTQILQEVGYDDEDIRTIGIRFAASAAQYGGLYAAEDYISDVAGLVFGGAAIASGYDVPYWISFASAGVYYATKAIKIEQTLSMAKDPRMVALPNPTAVISYHLFEKMFADKPHVIDWATRIGYMANPLEIVQERWWATFLPTPEVFLAGNVTASVVNAVQSGLIEGSKKGQIKAAEFISQKKVKK